MENRPKLPISGAAEANKKTWVFPTVELIGKNTIEHGHTSYPLEGKQVIGEFDSSTIYGDGVGS